MAKKALNNSETRKFLYKEFHANILVLAVTKLQVAEKSYVHPAHPRVWFHPHHSIDRLREDFSEAKMGRPRSPYSESKWEAEEGFGSPHTKVLFESLINVDQLPALKEAEEEAQELHEMVDKALKGLDRYNTHISRRTGNGSSLELPFGDYGVGTLVEALYHEYTHARRLIAEGYGADAFRMFLENIEAPIKEILKPIEDYMELLRDKYLDPSLLKRS